MKSSGAARLAEFVQDDEVEPGEIIGEPSGPSSARLGFEFVHQIDSVAESAALAGAGDGDRQSVLPVPVEAESYCRETGDRGIVTYPFHPRHGQRVPVTGVKRHACADHLVARQPDGTLSLLPVWMTRPEVGARQLVAAPHLPVGVLFDLRGLIDALLDAVMAPA